MSTVTTEYKLSLTASEMDYKLTNALVHSVQELTNEQKAQARENIGAVDKQYVDSMFSSYISEVAELVGGDA